MTSANDCNRGGEGVTLIYACAGASNVGQLSNDIAVELRKRGRGRMGCLMGLAADVSTMVQNAKAADRIIVVDGCGIACARKMVEKKGLEPDSFIVTEMGVTKNFDLDDGKDLIPTLTERITDSSDIPLMKSSGQGCGC